jgi:hypothetical protein
MVFQRVIVEEGSACAGWHHGDSWQVAHAILRDGGLRGQ